MKVDILWTNLHTDESKPMLEEMQKRAARCKEDGGTVQWLQSSTVVLSGQVQRAGHVSNADLTCTPITALTCILTQEDDDDRRR